MDKWKDIELEKMKVGGNKNAREFFLSQSDYNESMPIQQKYNTKAAALYQDKVIYFTNLFSNILATFSFLICKINFLPPIFKAFLANVHPLLSYIS